jgi:hypothetical protein
MAFNRKYSEYGRRRPASRPKVHQKSVKKLEKERRKSRKTKIHQERCTPKQICVSKEDEQDWTLTELYACRIEEYLYDRYYRQHRHRRKYQDHYKYYRQCEPRQDTYYATYEVYGMVTNGDVATMSKVLECNGVDKVQRAYCKYNYVYQNRGPYDSCLLCATYTPELRRLMVSHGVSCCDRGRWWNDEKCATGRWCGGYSAFQEWHKRPVAIEKLRSIADILSYKRVVQQKNMRRKTKYRRVTKSAGLLPTIMKQRLVDHKPLPTVAFPNEETVEMAVLQWVVKEANADMAREVNEYLNC